MTKGEFRAECKREAINFTKRFETKKVGGKGVERGGCVRDVLVQKQILKLVLSYKKPKSYKYYNGKDLRYRENNSRFYNILLYNALNFEVSMNYVTNMLRRIKKYNIFVPKVKNFAINIVKFRLPLSKNSFNIKEPEGYKNHNNIVINVAIIPVLGVCVVKDKRVLDFVNLDSKIDSKNRADSINLDSKNDFAKMDFIKKDSINNANFVKTDSKILANLDSNKDYKKANFIESKLENLQGFKDLDSKDSKYFKSEIIESNYQNSKKVIESRISQNLESKTPESKIKKDSKNIESKLDSKQIATFTNLNTMKNITFSNLYSINYNYKKGKVFKRIGFGKGMYDRFYAKSKIKPQSIFVSRVKQATKEQICDAHDIESKIYLSVFKRNFNDKSFKK
ncbi:hypothetical protein [Helicobacter saguini]|uniref:hypothetical protein n=1 Tax=Helicobacter saguini TaxID=1548018 RepID=UPI00068AD887|nr:hypothetical protein [Helicobacter saguini]